MAMFNEMLLRLALLPDQWCDEDGQGMAEYAFILGLVAVGCIVAFTAFGGGLKNDMASIAGKI